MHTIKNSNGNIVIYQSPSLKSCWGYIDSYGDYYTERDASKGQIFHLYGNSIAIQLEILEMLERGYIKRNIKVWVTKYEKENFWAVCPVKDFRALAYDYQDATGKAAIFCYDKLNYLKYGKQIRLPMNYWTREYKNQSKLV